MPILTPDQPQLMVLGDSLAQGCRSVTVTEKFCAQSYPALAAAAAGLSLTTPRHPRPILFQLEHVAENFVIKALKSLLGGIATNYRNWSRQFESGPLSGPVTFDNLAVAGFRLEDLLGRAEVPWEAGTESSPSARINLLGLGTAAQCDLARSGFKELNLLDSNHRSAISALHIATNARYVLNPSNHPDVMHYTVFDWVNLRKPRTVLLGIGHNNGLVRFIREGNDSTFRKLWVDGGRPALALFEEILDRLASVTPSSSRVIVTSLPKLSSVANLDREPIGSPSLPYPTGNYTTRFLPGNVVSGTTAREIDECLIDINQRLRALVKRTNPAWEWLDAYSVLQSLDFKNSGDVKRKVAVPGRSLDNRYLRGERVNVPGHPHKGDRKLRWKLVRGGLFSIDGCHPSAVGYARMALELYTVLTGTVPTAEQAARVFAEAARNERLVTNYPAALDSLLDLFGRFAGKSTGADSVSLNEQRRRAWTECVSVCAQRI